MHGQKRSFCCRKFTKCALVKRWKEQHFLLTLSMDGDFFLRCFQWNMSSLFSPIGTSGYFLCLILTSLSHISKALMTETTRCVVWVAECRSRLNRHPLLSFRENDPLFYASHFSLLFPPPSSLITSFTHGWRWMGENEKLLLRLGRERQASDVWKAIFAGDMVKRENPSGDFPFCCALLRRSSFTLFMFGLFKKNGIVVVVFFYRPYMENFLGKMNLFSLSHMYVYIMFTQMPSDIFIYTSFCLCQDGRRRWIGLWRYEEEEEE